MRILMIAPPGAGKGTQGALIAAHFGIPCIAIGEKLRDQVARQTDVGRAVQSHLDRGELVPDEIVMDLVHDGYVAAKAAGGEYVVDGVPRTMAQARAMYLIGTDLKLTANVALHLNADDQETTRRLRARAAMRPLVDYVPEHLRRPVDLSGLDSAFGHVPAATPQG
ncbi:nucleoside monophosphate kinase [Dactylosporangium sp. NPDC049525]|uniref:adenylate kinase family protein n=1 Tax=Dactylosporangium sp. NPDC049525 TaxID=3154730 RepID=UPI00341CEAC3